MLFSGILQMAQKLATQHGDCLALVSFWKNSIGSYHENGKVLSQQIGKGAVYALVYFCRLPDTNIEGDLKVEHQNLELKTGLINLAGKYFRDRHSFKCAAVEARKM